MEDTVGAIREKSLGPCTQRSPRFLFKAYLSFLNGEAWIQLKNYEVSWKFLKWLPFWCSRFLILSRAVWSAWGNLGWPGVNSTQFIGVMSQRPNYIVCNSFFYPPTMAFLFQLEFLTFLSNRTHQKLRLEMIYSRTCTSSSICRMNSLQLSSTSRANILQLSINYSWWGPDAQCECGIDAEVAAAESAWVELPYSFDDTVSTLCDETRKLQYRNLQCDRIQYQHAQYRAIICTLSDQQRDLL